jgi:hypothetical protein
MRNYPPFPKATPHLQGRLPTRSSPVRHAATRKPRVRLACIRHAASVDPEPGSNSPPKCLCASDARPTAETPGFDPTTWCFCCGPARACALRSLGSKLLCVRTDRRPPAAAIPKRIPPPAMRQSALTPSSTARSPPRPHPCQRAFRPYFRPETFALGFEGSRTIQTRCRSVKDFSTAIAKAGRCDSVAVASAQDAGPVPTSTRSCDGT